MILHRLLVHENIYLNQYEALHFRDNLIEASNSILERQQEQIIVKKMEGGAGHKSGLKSHVLKDIQDHKDGHCKCTPFFGTKWSMDLKKRNPDYTKIGQHFLLFQPSMQEILVKLIP